MFLCRFYFFTHNQWLLNMCWYLIIHFLNKIAFNIINWIRHKRINEQKGLVCLSMDRRIDRFRQWKCDHVAKRSLLFRFLLHSLSLSMCAHCSYRAVRLTIIFTRHWLSMALHNRHIYLWVFICWSVVILVLLMMAQSDNSTENRKWNSENEIEKNEKEKKKERNAFWE